MSRMPAPHLRRELGERGSRKGRGDPPGAHGGPHAHGGRPDPAVLAPKISTARHLLLPSRAAMFPAEAPARAAAGHGGGHGVGLHRRRAARAQLVGLAATAEVTAPRSTHGRHASRVPHPSRRQARVHRHRRLHPSPGRRPRRAQEETNYVIRLRGDSGAAVAESLAGLQRWSM